MEDLYIIAASILNVLILFLVGRYGNLYMKFKAKMSALSNLIVEIDKALADDTITKDEMETILVRVRALLAKSK